MSSTRKKFGLALGSGGVRGLVHIGVIKTLVKYNLPIDFIAGTSVGAWVGACYSTYRDLEKLTAMTSGYKKEKLLSFLQPTLQGGFVKGKKVASLLSELLGDNTFADLQIPLTVVATDLISGQEVNISSGPVVPAVQASMAIPVVYKPIQYQDKLLVDGGLVNPVPDDIVRGMGADVVLAVNLDNYIAQYFASDRLSISRTVSRSLNIGRHYLAQYSTRVADIVIEPSIPLIGFSGWKKFFMDQTDQDIIRIGERETEAIIPELRRLLAN